MQLVMAMVTGCQWDGATLALKSQQPVMDRIWASIRPRVYVGERRESNTLNTNTDMKGPTRGFKVCAKGLATRAAGQSARQARFRGTIAQASWATSTWSHHTSSSVRRMRGQAGSGQQRRRGHASRRGADSDIGMRRRWWTLGGLLPTSSGLPGEFPR